MEKLEHKKDIGTMAKVSGVAMIAIVGLMHLVLAPEHFEQAAYVGVLFALNFVGASIAAVGIARGKLSWGWTLGAVVAVASFVLYFVTRTVGLPSFNPSELFEPLGLVGLLFEALFTAVYLFAMTRMASK
jgi:hypothetical protein